MADSFKYGDYAFSFVRTVAFDDEPEFDPSNTDRLHNRYRITVQGVLATGLNPSTGNETPADTLKRIREDLLAPRQSLTYGQNGKTIISVTDPPDAANGPFPQSFRTILVSPGSLTVEFTVDVRIADCQLGKTRGWSSNRWEAKDSYDKLGYCTTTTTGLLIARSDLNNAGPDEFRGMAVPAIRNGFQREDWSFAVSPDGLRLAYTFTDKEYYLPPPLSALEWDGDFKVVSVGGRVEGTCNVEIKGAKGADKGALWRRANEICLARILPIITDRNDEIPVGTVGFSERLNGAEVSVFYKVVVDAAKLNAAVAGGGIGQGAIKGLVGGQTAMYGSNLIGAPIPGCSFFNQPGVAPPIRGNHPMIRLVAAVFRDPCYLTTFLATNGPLVPGGNSTGTLANNPRNPTPPPLGNPAQITVTDLSRFNPGGGRNAPSLPVYQRYSVRSTYVNRMNTTTLTPTDADKPRTAVDLGPPELDLVVEWVCERHGNMPEIPDPCPPSYACDLYKLLLQVVSADDPAVTPTGELLHKVYGRYEYACLDPARVNLVEPLPPFLVPQVRVMNPFTKNQDVIWKFLTVPQSAYWQRCCEAGAAAKPPLNQELAGNPGVLGAPPGTVGGTGIGPFGGGGPLSPLLGPIGGTLSGSQPAPGG